MVSLKTKVIIEGILIVFILTLCTLIYQNGKDLSCDQCKITFTQTEQNGIRLPEPRVINLKAIDIYNLYKEEICLVSWDAQNGYIVR